MIISAYSDQSRRTAGGKAWEAPAHQSLQVLSRDLPDFCSVQAIVEFEAALNTAKHSRFKLRTSSMGAMYCDSFLSQVFFIIWRKFYSLEFIGTGLMWNNCW